MERDWREIGRGGGHACEAIRTTFVHGPGSLVPPGDTVIKCNPRAAPQAPRPPDIYGPGTWRKPWTRGGRATAGTGDRAALRWSCWHGTSGQWDKSPSLGEHCCVSGPHL